MSVYTKYFSYSNSLASPWNAFIQWQRAIVTGLFIVTSSLLVFPDVAISEDVKKLKYRNEGAYVARFYVRWITPDGVTCGGYQDYSFYTSSTTKTVTVDLGHDINMMNRFSDINKCKALSDGFSNLRIPEGSRVWGVVEIESGDRVSCKGTKRTIYKNNGGELKYKTQGTTKNNNRCFHTN